MTDRSETRRSSRVCGLAVSRSPNSGATFHGWSQPIAISPVTHDRSFVERNRAATERIRTLAEHLSDQELQQRVGQHWTVAIALAHLAFWDRRVMHALDLKEQGSTAPDIDLCVNDLSLPLWAAIPPRQAVSLALAAAAALDARLETYPPDLLDEIYTHNKRWVMRALHRDEHLDEIDAALKQ